MFTHLHVHSHYSLLDGLPKIENLVKCAKKFNMESLAITDHGVLYGVIEFYKKAKKAGIKPIIGMEAYVATNGLHLKRPKIDDERYHLTLLAKNNQGYKNLVKLTTIAHLEGFYYKPRIDKDLLRQCKDGLIVLSGCLAGEIPQLIIAGKIDKAYQVAKEYRDIFGEDFYLELQSHPNIKEQSIANERIIKISKELNIPVVATCDAHYLYPEDADAQDILVCVQTNHKVEEKERLTMKQDDFSLKSPTQMETEFSYIPEAIKNTEKIAAQCNVEFNFGEVKLPYFDIPENKNKDEYLEELCLEGLRKKYNIDILSLKEIPSDLATSKQEIINRLKFELDVIKKTRFADYFLIVQDLVKWAKTNGIVVGPGRGSAAGSIVSYLLDITAVDPLKYNLLFERFLNPDRVSLPDIDLDFADTRRDEVIAYVAQKYGKENVCQIITFGTMAARAAIRDVGRALGYTYTFCDQVAKMIPFGFNLNMALNRVLEFRQLYESDEQAKILIDFAKKLEGVARHTSIHACGVVISREPLIEEIPLQRATQNDNIITTQYEMNTISELGFLKMDFLGLRNLTIIENCLNLIEKTTGEKIDINQIKLDDASVFKMLQRGETIGIFQLESEGMQNCLKSIKPTELEDLIAIIALYRPGPIEFIPLYAKRKQGKESIVYLHEKLRPILEKTYGIPIYQEQIMEIAKQLAGFTPGEADILRKAIGKKIATLLEEQKIKFINGMINNGINEHVAREIWHWVEPFAHYGFNRSHSVCYALIAYQTAFLKHYYPLEFMTVLLNSESDDVERIAFLKNEAVKMGIKILPPDVNKSYENFTIDKECNAIRFGLAAIKNVGKNIAKAIIDEREKNGEYQSFVDFIERLVSKELNKKTLESLAKAGALDFCEERKKIIENMEDILNYMRNFKKVENSTQQSLFGKNGSISRYRLFSLNLKDTPPSSKQEKLRWEKELLGFYISGHPLDEVRDKIAVACPIKQISNNIEDYIIAGVIKSLKKIITKNGEAMVFADVEDYSGSIETIIFPKILNQYFSAVQEGKIVLIKGKSSRRDAKLKFIAIEIKEIL